MAEHDLVLADGHAEIRQRRIAFGLAIKRYLRPRLGVYAETAGRNRHADVRDLTSADGQCSGHPHSVGRVDQIDLIRSLRRDDWPVTSRAEYPVALKNFQFDWCLEFDAARALFAR